MQHVQTGLRGKAGNVSLAREDMCFSLMSSLCGTEWNWAWNFQDKPLLLPTASCKVLFYPSSHAKAAPLPQGISAFMQHFPATWNLSLEKKDLFLEEQLQRKRNIHTFSSFWIAFLRDLSKRSCNYPSTNWSNLSATVRETPSITYYCSAHSHQLKTQIPSREHQAGARHPTCTWPFSKY